MWLIEEDMDKVITSIPGLENLLRGQDLPVICKLDPEHPILNFYIKETSAMSKASSIILNTFQSLESSIISKFSTIFPKVYTLGPLHSLLKTHVNDSLSNKDTSCITPLNSVLYNTISVKRKIDTGMNPKLNEFYICDSLSCLSLSSSFIASNPNSCITWLNSHHPNTVLYVSFGTVMCLSRDQVMECWHGLVNSGKPFLWVLREDLINAEDGGGGGSIFSQGVPAEIEVGTKERGLLVDWAPQEEVLAHPSVGGFLSHSGWNSTLESISEGVPLICWPLIADQTVNSRCVSEMWRVGIDMKGSCDRVIVEKMVKDLMENKREEIVRSTTEIAKMASESVENGGSSYRDLEKLIEDIRSMSLNNN